MPWLIGSRYGDWVTSGSDKPRKAPLQRLHIKSEGKSNSVNRTSQCSLIMLVLLTGLANLTFGADCAPQPPGLVSWWRADGDANDFTGTNHGTLFGPVAFANGMVGHGFLFSPGSGVSLGNVPAFDFATNSSFSIEAWFNSFGPTPPPDDGQAIVTLNFNCTPTLQTLVMANSVPAYGVVNFAVRDANNLQGLVRTPAVSSNEFHHVVGVRDAGGVGRTLRLYLDGVLVDTAPDPSSGPLAIDTLDWIGRRNTCGSDNVFNGIIDEVSIYNRALTSQEVLALYSAGSSGKCLVSPTLQLTPTNAAIAAGQSLPFIAAGGTLPYSFSLVTNASGGSINATSGVYAAGLQADVIDVVQLTDGQSNQVTAAIRVVEPVFVVTNTADSGLGSLQRAIQQANASAASRSRVEFNIPGTPPFVIRPLTLLSPLARPMTIDGFSQPGFSGTPVIEINGTNFINNANGFGLFVTSSNCVIRGLAVNRFGHAGIELSGAGGHVLQGCFLGTDSAGTNAAGSPSGLVISSGNNLVGGTNVAERNLIAGNSAGISFRTRNGEGSTIVNNVIQGNLVGTDLTGTQHLGAQQVALSADFSPSPGRNTIGGSAPGRGNVIAFHTVNGVSVTGSGTHGIEIRGNSIFSNRGLGIELGTGGVTPNDPGDGDIGANNLQNFPVITSVHGPGASPVIQGSLNSTPNAAFTLDFYASPACDPSGNGQGQRYLGFTNVTTGASGNGLFTFSPSVAGASVALGEVVTATATDAGGNTSEFSACAGFAVIISGRVGDSGGAAIAGAAITLRAAGGGILQSVATDGAGAFSLNPVAAGANYSVQVAHPAFVFAVGSLDLTNVLQDQQLTFTGTPIPLSVIGRVFNSSGAGLPGVSLKLQLAGGKSVQTVLSDSTGGYAFSNLVFGNYSLTPVEAPLTFTPAFKNLALISTDATVNFTATNTFQISGIVKTNGVVARGMKVLFDDAGTGLNVAATVSTASGAYLRALPAGRSYVLRTASPGYVFTPATITVPAFLGDLPNQNFLGTQVFVRISGVVTNSAGSPLSFGQVLINTTNLPANLNSSGFYSFLNLPGSASYTLTPSRSNFVFTPPSVTLTNLTSNQLVNFRAAPLVPLAGRIAFRNLKQLSFMNADGTGLLNAATPFWNTLDPGNIVGNSAALSPDGNQVVLDRSVVLSASPLWIANADGSSAAPIPSVPPVGTFMPKWSPDGKRLAVGAAGGGGPILLLNPDGSGLTTFGVGLEPSWSPDGQWLAFSSLHDIYKAMTNGTQLQQLDQPSALEAEPAWSPDGAKIAFASERDGNREIYIMNQDGTAQQRLTFNTGDDRFPAWSPDGTMIAFDRNPGIWVMEPDGTQQTMLAPVGEKPSWAPAPSTATPVGTNVAITNGNVTVTYSQVESLGTTTVLPVPPSASGFPPGYVSIPLAGLNFDISTTATNSGPITLCFKVPTNITVSVFTGLRILHGEGGVLVDRTILSGPNAPSFAHETICALVSSLSPFAIAQQIDPAQAMISGQVVDPDGNPIPAVSVQLAETDLPQAISDGDGAFTLANLENGSDYTVVPVSDFYDFNPPLALFTNITDTNPIVFVATPKPPPTLRITSDPAVTGQYILSWDLLADGYVLESSGSLDAPSWSPAPGQPFAVGDRFTVALQTAGVSRFFRLERH